MTPSWPLDDSQPTETSHALSRNGTVAFGGAFDTLGTLLERKAQGGVDEI